MKDLKSQFGHALLVVVTVAAIIAAWFSFQARKHYHLPTDGAVWSERKTGSVEAIWLDEAGGAYRSGVRLHDRLVAIRGRAILSPLDVSRAVFQIGTWTSTEYALERGGIPFKAMVSLAEENTPPIVFYLYAVGVVYLLIGIVVYLRRGNAPKAQHFFLLCLFSFLFCSFHYTGKLNQFDKIVYWCNVIGGLLAPSTFLHFTLTFPGSLSRSRKVGWQVLLYLPAALLLALYALAAPGLVRFPVDTSTTAARSRPDLDAAVLPAVPSRWYLPGRAL